jgi:DNA-binding transcriptional regulator YiaG
METTKNETPRAKHPGGRPPGSRTSKPSDLVFRVRTASGKSQDDFANELGCSTSAVSKFEQDNRTPGTKALQNQLLALAKKYGVTP